MYKYNYKDKVDAPRCQKISIRFMGLFDTVLSYNDAVYANPDLKIPFTRTFRYNMDVSDTIPYVAQAVALNEYRDTSTSAAIGLSDLYETRVPLPNKQHYGGFPLESIGASSNSNGKVRVERGFIGSHADIGGGYRGYGLSLVALNWMVQQAKLAGVPMNNVAPIPIGDPLIHDKSNAIQSTWGVPYKDRFDTFGIQRSGSIKYYHVEDRDVYGAVKGSEQRTMQFNNNSMTNADTHQFIDYRERDSLAPPSSPLNPRNFREITGFVKISGYKQWLEQHGYKLQ